MQFQRAARRHDKAFFREKCKEIEKDKSNGKDWRILLKIGDIMGTFHELKETEIIKKRWHEYTEKPFKKDFVT